MLLWIVIIGSVWEKEMEEGNSNKQKKILDIKEQLEDPHHAFFLLISWFMTTFIDVYGWFCRLRHSLDIWENQDMKCLLQVTFISQKNIIKIGTGSTIETTKQCHIVTERENPKSRRYLLRN